MSHKLKITLEYTDPKVYRTVIVPEKITFDDLHLVIQCVMNWENSHLYQFNLGSPYASDSITEPDEDEMDNFFSSRFKKYDSTKTYLSDFFNGQIKKMSYIYDYGDDWIHNITVLKKPSEEVLYPICIKGENTAPIDDIGGISGFYDLMETMGKKRKNAKDKEMLDWYGLPKTKTYEEFFRFDLDEINEILLENFKQS
ncbi:MAG: plasmid pRiA4b ORF-3 family protein [Bacteroidetes bacterium]|nr:plasmid pRiA4b ORF-3 family protein [Bacteroidota bacterium]